MSGPLILNLLPYMPSKNRHVKCEVTCGHSSTAGVEVLLHSLLTLTAGASEEITQVLHEMLAVPCAKIKAGQCPTV
jgi:hypothetical protein